MDRTRLANIAADITLKRFFTDADVRVISRNFENGDYAVLIKHVEPRYEYGYEYMGIYNFNSVEVAKERHEIMLEVMAGERLIPDDSDIHISEENRNVDTI